MMKPILGLLVVMAAVTAVGQTAKPREATLTQQKMCAERAHKVFHEDLNPLHPAFIEWDYTSHYDVKSNRCFMETRYYDADNILFAVLDAFELREHASFAQNKGVLGFCDITRPGHDEEHCKSIEEFSTLVEKYFGVGR
jgi:hypothetical protein